MKRNFAVLAVSLVLAVTAFAQTSRISAKSHCCTSCCQDQCSDCCGDSGCDMGCCQGK